MVPNLGAGKVNQFPRTINTAWARQKTLAVDTALVIGLGLAIPEFWRLPEQSKPGHKREPEWRP